jgi:hypothetical protein
MKLRTCLYATLVCHLAPVASQGQSGPGATGKAIVFGMGRRGGEVRAKIIAHNGWKAVALQEANRVR